MFEPLYQIKLNPTELEQRIINTYWFQRLKYIHHAGMDFTYSYKTHTRYQHSLGVYALASKYYPDNQLVRVSSLLHDVGHLPFSHAVEDAYHTMGGKSVHHKFTKDILFKTEISDILRDYGIPPRLVYDIGEGNHKSPLKPKKNILGMDLFDCFIRDTYYSGVMHRKPSNFIKRVVIDDNGVNGDMKTAFRAHLLIVKDHDLMFNRESIIRSALGQRLFELVLRKTGMKEEMFKSTEYEMMKEILKIAKKDKKVKHVLDSLLFTNNFKVKYLHKRREKDHPEDDQIRYCIKKVYPKTMLVKKKPLDKINREVAKQLKDLNNYVGTYVVWE